MTTKLIGIFVCTLLIVTSFPAKGIELKIENLSVENNIDKNKEIINYPYWNYDRPSFNNYKLNNAIISELHKDDTPSTFDLRNVDGKNYVTSIKCQSGGTCWAHAIFAAMEGNLLMTNNWEKAGEIGEPNLAEYHLDWWNGFNKFNNDDDPGGEGLTVHHGAHIKIASAYFARGEGAVFSEDANDETEYDYPWYENPPNRFDENYHLYYPRHIEIYDIGEDLSNIDLIKNKIMTHGPINILFRIDSKFMDENYTHYQPPNSSDYPNHNVAIIGWDNNKITPAPNKGAWLCKNSWGSDWGLNGYFWISYYDKYCCHHDPDEWTATFQEVEPMPYKHIYYHDYHGWQDTLTISNEAFNVFTSQDNEVLKAISFYTCSNNVDFVVRIYDDFEEGELKGELSNLSGNIETMGFHTYELNQPVNLIYNDQFYIYLKLSEGGIPFDRTHDVWGNTIESISHPGESYYYQDTWNDLYDYNNTANFCIKGLVSKTSDLECDKNINWLKVKPGSILSDNFSIENIGESFSKLNWKISEHPDWGTWTFSQNEGTKLYPESEPFIVELSVVAPNEGNKKFTGEIKIVNKDDLSDYEIIPITLKTPRNRANNRPFLSLFNNFNNFFPVLKILL